MSYAREDLSQARRLAGELRRAGYDPWLDEERLLPGEHWRSAIVTAIKSSIAFILLLSNKSATKKGFVQNEIRTALKAVESIPPDEIYIIPALLEPCEPKHEQFEDIHWVNMWPDWDLAVGRIMTALRTLLPQSPNLLTSILERVCRDEHLIVAHRHPGSKFVIEEDLPLPENDIFSQLLELEEDYPQAVILPVDMFALGNSYRYSISYNILRVARDHSAFASRRSDLEAAFRADEYDNDDHEKYWHDFDGCSAFFKEVVHSIPLSVVVVIRGLRWTVEFNQEETFSHIPELQALRGAMTIVFDLWKTADWTEIKTLLDCVVDDTVQSRLCHPCSTAGKALASEAE
ncbi:MAG: toll/interleukin-1 receptor domain-containing protein [Acidobacteriota bacterium]